MTIECNGMHGAWTIDEMESRARYLVAMGRAIPAQQWVTGLVRKGHQCAQGAVLEGLI